MKALIINTYDILGGAARAAFSLHKGFKKIGVNSTMIVKRKLSDDLDVIETRNNFVDKIYDRAARKHEKSLEKKFKFGVNQLSLGKYSNLTLIKKINSYNADIVNLNWINDRFLSIEDIPKIKAPLVWTMQDMWPFSSGYHYNQEYIFEESQIKTSLTKETSLNEKIINRKLNTLSKKKDIYPVGISKWLSNEAKKSEVFKNREITTIGNSIDTSIFFPHDKNQSKNLFNLPTNKFLILFGAIQSTSDPRKGFPVVEYVINKIKDPNIEFVVFGNKDHNINFENNKIHSIGEINDDKKLAQLYSACDLLINPSLQEGFGLVPVEAMSCGLPVIAFNHTGFLDTIDHKINGYLAESFDLNDFLNGIYWFISYKDKFNLMNECTKKALNFSSESIAQQYINLYKKILIK